MTIQNPYPALGPKIKTALDAIIISLPLSPTFENLNDALFNAVFAIDPPTDELTILYIKSVLPNVYNSYLNGAVTLSVVEGSQTIYSQKQILVITETLNTLRTAPTETIPQFLSLTDEKIATSGLTIAEQAPLFVATTAGKATYEYWLQQIPQPSSWAAYMVNPNITPQAMDALNYANVGSWVSASMQGALLAWGSINLPKIEFIDMMAAYLGATGMAAGKVVFKW
jgi:hypothetical protein